MSKRKRKRGLAAVLDGPSTFFQIPPRVIQRGSVDAERHQNRKPPPGSWRDFGKTMGELRKLRGQNRDTAEGELSKEAQEHLAAEARRKKADK